MRYIPERGSTHVYHVAKMNKDEMDELIGRCTYENPPFCNAACPLKLDTKAMLAAVAAGDFNKALQIYRKATPFPALLSRGCDAPCESRCRMNEVGDGIKIRSIEQLIAACGEEKAGSSVFRMKKKKTVALFGSDLFTLFLAGELEKKMYPVTVFTEAGDMESFLGMNGAADELSRLRRMDIDFGYGVPPTELADRREEFDIVCASEAAAKTAYPEASCDEKLMYCREYGIVMGAGSGVLECAFNAKKAALSVDRLAQRLDPANSRGDEGAVNSRLYTDLSAATMKKAVPVTDRDSAVGEASRCIQCSCEECVKGCAFLAHYGKKPGLIGREIFNNTQIIMGDHQLNKPMNSCSLCGQCTVLCPNGFDMAKVCKSARENMVATDKMPHSPHEFALMDMFFSNDEAFLSRKQPGFDKCRYVFFPGCQASAIAPATVRAAYEDLCQRLDGGVALMLGCCGAIADWAGRIDYHEEMLSFMDEELSRLGNPVIIAGCPSCKKELSRHETVGIWDILNQIGLKRERSVGRSFAMHDSCGARGDAGTQRAVRELAEKLGCELIDTPYSGEETMCCGYGGLAGYANRELAGEMTELCLSLSDAPYISYCMACRDRFARKGRESRHILELVYGTDAGDPPDISEKRYNRLTLKRELLSELWGETMTDTKTDFTIEYTDEARRLMEDRMILTDDVEQVLKSVHESGEAIFDEESGLTIANCRLGNVTFWVKFTETEGGYLVHRAYSHRMTVQKRAGT